MMNEARFGVGIQGVGLGERAYQFALAHARERVQGRDAVSGESGRPILCHPDVKRMMLSMRARVMAMRALLYAAAGWFDRARHHPDAEVAAKCRRYVDLLMPVAKGWCTEVGNEVCDDAIQVFGGMGFVEETGIAQFFRDARIITIYEGTTGIQGNDLIGRKILREKGETLHELVADMGTTLAALQLAGGLDEIAAGLAENLAALRQARDWVLGKGGERPGEVLAGAVPFLMLLGTVCGGWQLARAALAAQRRLQGGGGPGRRGGGATRSTCRAWWNSCASISPPSVPRRPRMRRPSAGQGRPWRATPRRRSERWRGARSPSGLERGCFINIGKN